MKKHLFIKKLLVLLVVLITSVSQMWAANSEYGKGKVIYLDISNGATTGGWRQDENSLSYKIKMYYEDSDAADKIIGEFCATRIGDSHVYYAKTNNDYVRYMQALRCAGNCGTQHNYSYRRGCSSRSYNHDNCIRLPSSQYNYWDQWSPEWTCYVPSMASATISKNASCVVYGGDGTSGNPYLVANSSSIVLDASATSVVTDDTAPTKEYKYWYKTNNGSRVQLRDFSSTSSHTFTASGTTGTTYEIDVEARNNNNSNYGASTATSSKIYFQTIAPIYAILGTFNSWTHSAATWDLVNQGSGNWDASFLLKSGSHEFKVVFNNGYYGKGTEESYTTLTRNSTNTSGLTVGQNNLKLTADYAGTYTFRYNTSGSVTVTFPTKRQVNYSAVTIGSGTGQSSSPTAENDTDDDKAISNGGYVGDGNSVTFRAKTENSGYTWRGWYSVNNPSAANWSTNCLSTSKDYTVTVSGGNKTVYAVYSQNEYNTTVAVAPAGTKATTSPSAGTVAIKQATGTEITASAATDSIFEDWTISGGGLTMVSSSTTNPNTFKATSTGGTITANFTPQWTIAGTMTDPTWKWDKTSNLLTGYTTISSKKHATKTIALAANTTYNFKVKDRSQDKDNGWYGIASGSTNTYTYANDNTAKTITNASGNQNISLTTAAAGDYVFDFNLTDKQISVDFPTSWKITFGQQTVFNTHRFGINQEDNEDPHNNDNTGGHVTAVDGESNTLSSNDYIVDNGSVTFTAVPESGYQFAGWYSDESCTTPYKKYGVTDKTNPLTVSSIDEDKTYYAKFEEIITSVVLSNKNGAGHVEIGGEVAPLTVYVGVHTTVDITAVPIEGYYFAGWEERDDAGKCSVADYTEDGRTTTLSGAGTSDAYATTLYALYEQLDVIYFKNLVNWTNVYVYFNPTWDHANNPIYSKGVYPKDLGCTCVLMSGTGDYRYAYIPRKYSRAGSADILRRVAFSDVDMHDYTNFSGNHAVYRPDWNEKLDTYVPAANGTGGATSIGTGAASFNGTTYYNEGYWMERSPRADEGIGYYIKCDALSVDVQFTSQASGYNMGVAKVRIDDVSTARTFYVSSLQSTIYAGSGSITSLTTDPSTLYYYNSGTGSLSVTFTSEGDYTFYLYQDGAHMTLKVDYPVSPGDYRLLHTYGAKSRASDPIKKDALSATQQNIVSMYIDPTNGANTLVLQKCTSIDGETKLPVWSTGVSVGTLSSLFTVDVDDVPTATKGVYYFTVNIDNTDKTVSQDVKSVSLSDINPYEGKFYIKTNCANGGWTNYTRNALNKNTLNPSAFDYYFCIYLNSTTTNIKCVIANDYSNQISDTLATDAILTRDAVKYETLPEAASVRFSFNSKTCELKRTYMLGSSSGSSFLFIVSDEDNMVYATDGTTDLHDLAEDNAGRKFKDLGNWVYELDVKTYPTAVAGVQTKYPSFGTINRQTLIPTDNVLIGGDEKGSTQYEIHLVYDFKTEYLMAAWTPTGAITTAIKDVDVLLARHGQEAGKTITFGAGGSLDAKKVIGALEFQYNELVGNVGGSWNQDIRELLMHFISFPFDVNVRDVFGFTGSYGWDWVIRKYNGAKRAEKGWFLGDGVSTFWDDLTMDSVMHAGEGYCVVLDNDYVNSRYSDCWTNKGTGSSIYMYFPSATEVGNVASQTATIKVPAHECKYDRPFINQHGNEVNHKYTDSHWNLMGVPLFTNQTDDASGTPGDIFIYHADPEEEPYDPTVMQYYYAWDTEYNEYKIADAASETFKTMHSYMVQYHGDVKFTGTRPVPASVAARKAPLQGNCKLELQVLNENEKVLNRAYVELRENACDTFELNEDVYMSPNNRAVILYTQAGNYDVAANVLSINNHVVPVGMNVKEAGTYTLAMPSNFNGTVTLIDTYTDTRTDLAMSDYTVNLPKGVNNERFQLEININKTPTAIDGAEDGSGSLKDGKAHKFIENGVMYILENGRIYDARGNRVQ